MLIIAVLSVISSLCQMVKDCASKGENIDNDKVGADVLLSRSDGAGLGEQVWWSRPGGAGLVEQESCMPCITVYILIIDLW